MDRTSPPTPLDELTTRVHNNAALLEYGIDPEELDTHFDVKIALDMGIRALAIAGIKSEAAAMNLLGAALAQIVAEFVGDNAPQYSILDAYTDQLGG